jgi:hypothetical protein
MTNSDGSDLNVAAELARLRGEMSTGFAEIKGQLGLIAQAQATHGEDIADLERRVTALEERRIPLGPLAAISGAVSAVVAALAFFLGQ